MYNYRKYYIIRTRVYCVVRNRRAVYLIVRDLKKILFLQRICTGKGNMIIVLVFTTIVVTNRYKHDGLVTLRRTRIELSACYKFKPFDRNCV